MYCTSLHLHTCIYKAILKEIRFRYTNFNECLHDNILYRQYHIHLKYIINKYQSALDVFTYLIKRELS